MNNKSCVIFLYIQNQIVLLTFLTVSCDMVDGGQRVLDVTQAKGSLVSIMQVAVWNRRGQSEEVCRPCHTKVSKPGVKLFGF